MEICFIEMIQQSYPNCNSPHSLLILPHGMSVYTENESIWKAKRQRTLISGDVASFLRCAQNWSDTNTAYSHADAST